ncbi:MAG TPA: ferritin-like domain-containing protein [Candidatus Acidoferrales bacterium]
MANKETEVLDDVIVAGRRKMLAMGISSLAGLAAGVGFFAKSAQAAAYTDADILNFALNLEYLEANFYYQAAFGTTIDVANSASTAAGAPLITLSGTVGTAGTVSGGSKVPFSVTQVGSYAVETAVEEGKHVKLLLGALGTAAVAQPALNIGTAFMTLATAAGIPNGASFSPYASDDNFLVGAYVFEDVGVTAYHGAASLLTTPANLTVAAGILAVEAYHAGLIRTSMNTIDPTQSSFAAYTNKISNLRATLSAAALLGATPGPYDSQPDDFGLATFQGSLAGGGNATCTRITDADQTNVIAFARNTTQVLNIVTGGGAVSGGNVVSPATGVFFPNGLNAGPNGFK